MPERYRRVQVRLPLFLVCSREICDSRPLCTTLRLVGLATPRRAPAALEHADASLDRPVRAAQTAGAPPLSTAAATSSSQALASAMCTRAGPRYPVPAPRAKQWPKLHLLAGWHRTTCILKSDTPKNGGGPFTPALQCRVAAACGAGADAACARQPASAPAWARNNSTLHSVQHARRSRSAARAVLT